MAAPKGHPKWGGRKKGVPNKHTLGMQARFEAAGADPVGVMIDLLKSGDEIMRYQAAKELIQYVHPKRKAIEITDPGGEAFGMAVTEAHAKLFCDVLGAIKRERK